MEKLVIKKRTSEEMACWKVSAEGVCPNTVIETDRGITLLVSVDGNNLMTAKNSFVVNSLVNPGKTTKLFGGKKPYASCEIYAIDMSTEFKSEWGLAGPSALPCYDDEFGVDAKAVCFGEYYYTVDDFYSFTRALPLGEKNEISRDDVREYFRSQTTAVVKSFLSSKVAGKDVKVCQGKLTEYSSDIKDQLNKVFDSKGITVQTFLVSNLDFEPTHKVYREKLKETKIGVKIKEVENDGRRDDISVDKERSEIDIGIIKAINGTDGDSDGKKSSGKKIRCSRCGEENDANDNYCFKCGEKLHK